MEKNKLVIGDPEPSIKVTKMSKKQFKKGVDGCRFIYRTRTKLQTT